MWKCDWTVGGRIIVYLAKDFPSASIAMVENGCFRQRLILPRIIFYFDLKVSRRKIAAHYQ